MLKVCKYSSGSSMHIKIYGHFESEFSHNFVKFQNLYLKYSVESYKNKFSEIDKLKALVFHKTRIRN